MADASKDLPNLIRWSVDRMGLIDLDLAIDAADEIERLQAELAELRNPTPCNCGYGGFHEPMNPRCDRNQAQASSTSEEAQSDTVNVNLRSADGQATVYEVRRDRG